MNIGRIKQNFFSRNACPENGFSSRRECLEHSEGFKEVLFLKYLNSPSQILLKLRSCTASDLMLSATLTKIISLTKLHISNISNTILSMGKASVSTRTTQTNITQTKIQKLRKIASGTPICAYVNAQASEV